MPNLAPRDIVAFVRGMSGQPEISNRDLITMLVSAANYVLDGN